MQECELCKFKKTDFFHNKYNYSYYHCSNCETLFLYPKPTLRDINNYYKNSFKYSAGETNEKQIRQRAKPILRNLFKLNPKGKSLLDIGCGYGYFLDEAIKFNLRCTGIEPSKRLFKISINRLNNRIINNDFDNFFIKNRNKKFDYITLIHTIEHVINPQKTIKQAIELLNPGGILFLETPNLKSHLFNSEKINYTFLTPPDHIWIFSIKSFKQILSNIPTAEIKNISSYSNPEHFMGIVKRFLKSFYIKQNNLSEVNTNPDKININKSININFLRKLKFSLFDKYISTLLTPILNIGIYGSILELHIRKK